MKNYISLVFASLICYVANAQNTTQTTLKLTGTDQVGFALPFQIDDTPTGLTFGSNTWGRQIRLSRLDNTYHYDIGLDESNEFFIMKRNSFDVAFKIASTGNIGIGTKNPVYPFHVWDGGTNAFTGTGIIPGNSSSQYSIINTLKTGGYGVILRAQNQDAGKGQAGIVLRTSNGSNIPSQVALIGEQLDFRVGNYATSIDDATPGTSALFINYLGNVGIGTSNTGSYKLAVEGKVAAREIRVTLDTPFPDYVFNKGYTLMSLASLEAFIQQNKHLPNIPSAQEVKEKEGIELGDMNVKLLEKIEELTLHMIEMNKEVQKLNNEVQQLKNENKTLKK